MNLYRVTMSKFKATFMVAAEDEGEAARAAERQWAAWKYTIGVRAISVEMVGFGGQYPPDTGGSTSDIAWFIPTPTPAPDRRK